MDTKHDLTLTYLPISEGQIKSLEELSGRVTTELNEAYRERHDAECWRFIRKYLDLQINGDTLRVTLNEPALAEALEPFATCLKQELPETEPPTLELAIHGGIMKEWGYTLDSFSQRSAPGSAASKEILHTGLAAKRQFDGEVAIDTSQDLTLAHLPISGGRVGALEKLSRQVIDELNNAYLERDHAECWRFICKFLELQSNDNTLRVSLNTPALAEALGPFSTRFKQELPETVPPTLELAIHGGIMKELGYI